MDINALFSADYQAARKKILQAALGAGIKIQTFELSGYFGDDGEPLCTDVILLGRKDARRVLMLSSGVHGVEGVCGSACQIAFIEEKLYLQLPEDVAVLIVHAVNPYGFANCRRWNEDNVDINRNFLDFSLPVEENNDYAAFHDMIFSEGGGARGIYSANQQLDKCIADIGVDDFVSKVALGQRSNPDGLFYAGSKPSWSNQTFRKIIDHYLLAVEELIFVDLHTGIGEFGQSTILYMPGLGDYFPRVKKVFSQAINPVDGSMAAIEVQGEIVFAFDKLAPQLSKFIPVTLEFGTLSTMELIEVLRVEQMVYQGWIDKQGDECLQVKRLLQDAYCCDDDRWKKMVVDGFLELCHQVVDAFLLPKRWCFPLKKTKLRYHKARV